MLHLLPSLTTPPPHATENRPHVSHQHDVRSASAWQRWKKALDDPSLTASVPLDMLDLAATITSFQGLESGGDRQREFFETVFPGLDARSRLAALEALYPGGGVDGTHRRTGIVAKVEARKLQGLGFTAMSGREKRQTIFNL